MRKAIIILAIASCCWNMAEAQPSTSVDSLYSESLGRTLPFSVLLPSDYNPANSYPFLYLFHGVGSNHQTWLNRSDIEDYIDEFPMVVIMPEGELSFYVNAYTEPKDRFEDFLINDLLNHVQRNYSTDPDMQAIGGFSMGGYGAVTLALKHPGLFKYVISVCGAISGARDLEEIKTQPNLAGLIPTLNRVFGEEPNDFRVAHDPFELYKNTPPENLPYIFIINGAHDPGRNVVEGQKEFADSLRSYGAYFEYHELPGAHNYQRTGDAALRLVFQRMSHLEEKTPRSFTNLLAKMIADVGIDKAIDWYSQNVKTTKDSLYYIDMAELNQLGYNLIGENKVDVSIAVFQLVIELYPNSANLYDSMSDAYIAKGDTALAIEAVKNCMKLIPDDLSLSDNLAHQLNEIAEEKLKSLGAE